MPVKNNDDGRSVVKSSTASDGAIVIEYDDGSKETVYSMADNKKSTALTVVGGSSSKGSSGSSGRYKSSSSGSSYSSSYGSSNSYYGGSSSGYGSNYGSSYGGSSGSYYSSNKPTHAFTALGVQFIGTPKYKLDDILFEEGDLIVNCTGTIWTPKAPPIPKVFAKETPSWMKLSEVLLSETKGHNYGERAQQLLLDWPDMKAPPKDANLDFWSSILEQARNNGIKRIIVCCQAGQGRTGTALSAFLLASGAIDEPDLAIDYIRENYNDKAVETRSQEEYIFSLVYEPVEDDPTDDSSTTKTPKTL